MFRGVGFLLLVTASPTVNAFTIPKHSTTPSFFVAGRTKNEQATTQRSSSISPDADDQCSLEDESASSCLSDVGYKLNKSSFVTVSEVYVSELESLRDKFESYENNEDEGSNVIKLHKPRTQAHPFGKKALNHNQRKDPASDDDDDSHVANIKYNNLITESDLILVDTLRKPGMKSISRAFHKAGPRKMLHFNPSEVNAAIVTCGGLCPGLNNVIRELVHSLYYLYGANSVYGIMGGYHGFHKPEFQPILLTNEMVENIHHEGGTVLRSSRGGFDIDKILTFLKEKNINQLYIIGGDGTHRGAYAIHEACIANNMNVAVAGIPKTIDNDIDYIDRSFGFVSAVEAAQQGIHTAKTEAICNVPNGIGIVKLMGRSAGFLAAFAALASGDVDLVLVPEIPIVLDGPNGILPFLRKRIKEKKYAVVVVAEGAGEELLGVSEEVDAGGNRKRPPIGEFISSKIQQYFEECGEEATIKYIDPSYTVRSVPANAVDSLYCMWLAQNAVHGAMAGITGFSVGLLNNRMVYFPIPQLVKSSPRSMDPYGMTWERIIAMTGQPNTAPPRKEKASLSEQTIEDFALPEPSLN